MHFLSKFLCDRVLGFFVKLGFVGLLESLGLLGLPVIKVIEVHILVLNITSFLELFDPAVFPWNSVFLLGLLGYYGE